MALTAFVGLESHLGSYPSSSDRGIQYCSYAYVNLLLDNNIKISMTENGRPDQKMPQQKEST